MAKQRYRRTITLLEAEVGDDLVVLDVQAGTCFGFNEVAATIWRELETPKSFDELRDTLVASYDVSIEECSVGLKDLLNEFVDKCFVEIEVEHGS
jgi:hypothetical protein